MLRKKVMTLILCGSLFFSNTALRAEKNVSTCKTGAACSQSATTATIVWASIGVAFILAIGIAVAVTISND